MQSFKYSFVWLSIVEDHQHMQSYNYSFVWLNIKISSICICKFNRPLWWGKVAATDVGSLLDVLISNRHHFYMIFPCKRRLWQIMWPIDSVGNGHIVHAVRYLTTITDLAIHKLNSWWSGFNANNAFTSIGIPTIILSVWCKPPCPKRRDSHWNGTLWYYVIDE